MTKVKDNLLKNPLSIKGTIINMNHNSFNNKNIEPKTFQAHFQMQQQHLAPLLSQPISTSLNPRIDQMVATGTTINNSSTHMLNIQNPHPSQTSVSFLPKQQSLSTTSSISSQMKVNIKPQTPQKSPRSPKTTKDHVNSANLQKHQQYQQQQALTKDKILFDLVESQHIPTAIIRNLPSVKLLSMGIFDWNNYTQSIYYINCFLQKFLQQIQCYTNKFDKLQLATQVLFVPLETLCNGCAEFLTELRKTPEHKSKPVFLNYQFTFDIPEDIKNKLDLISNISDERLGSLCTTSGNDSSSSWESNPYFNQINLNIIERMLSKGRKLMHHDFNTMIQNFTRHEPIKLTEHIEFIRQTISYSSFCKKAVSLLTKVSINTNTTTITTSGLNNNSNNHHQLENVSSNEQSTNYLLQSSSTASNAAGGSSFIHVTNDPIVMA